MPKAPNKPIRKRPAKKRPPKKGGSKSPKPQEQRSYSMRTIATCAALLALLSTWLAMPARADVETHPYGSLGVENVDERWSNNATFGCEVTSGKVYLNGRFTVHDFWREKAKTPEDGIEIQGDPVPWDQTFDVSLGLFTSDYGILGLESNPYAGLRVSRPNEPDRFSVGAEGGLEFAFARYFADIGIHIPDIFTEDGSELYPWDFSAGAKVGIWFGDQKEK
jgi:hypothetical protein